MCSAWLVTIVVLAGTGGEIAAAHAMRQLGRIEYFSPLALLDRLGRAFRLGWMWIGIGLMAIAFFSFLVLLSWEPVSFAVPVTAVSYAVGALGAKIFLGEQVSALRWAGVFLVCLGVALVWMG